MPLVDSEQILLGHGSGGKLTARLIEQTILPALRNPILEALDDQAILPVDQGRVAFTTDSYVVTPIFFPGGDIGELAVNGTVNDLAVGGARPLWLSLALILEEGLLLSELERVVASVKRAAARAGVTVVTGDTKVVGKGSGDKVFINTSGIGVVPDGVVLGSAQVLGFTLPENSWKNSRDRVCTASACANIASRSVLPAASATSLQIRWSSGKTRP